MNPKTVLDTCENLLSKAAAETNNYLRFFSFATQQKSNLPPANRMVVMRSFEPDWTIRFYTDYRSDKITQLKEYPGASLLFWSPSNRIQMRLMAQCWIHHQNQIASNEWGKISGDSVKAYTSVLSPGTMIDHPDESFNWPEKPTSENFAVVDCNPSVLKVLQIDGSEHLSLQFKRSSKNTPWRGSWIVP
jgi:general stress protein 26